MSDDSPTQPIASDTRPSEAMPAALDTTTAMDDMPAIKETVPVDVSQEQHDGAVLPHLTPPTPALLPEHHTLPAPLPAAPAMMPHETGRPRREDYASTEAYEDAVADHRFTQRQHALALEVQQQQQLLAQQQRQAAWRVKTEQALKHYDDFTETVLNNPHPVFQSPPLVDAIMEADDGAALAYHLAKHPREADKLAQLPVPKALTELGRLAAGITTPAAPQPTQAPPPLGRLTGRTAGATQKTIDHMSQAEFEAYYQHTYGQRPY